MADVAAVSPIWVAAKSSQRVSSLTGLFNFITMKKKLLFVCVENSNRSQMSQAFAKIWAVNM